MLNSRQELFVYIEAQWRAQCGDDAMLTDLPGESLEQIISRLRQILQNSRRKKTLGLAWILN